MGVTQNTKEWGKLHNDEINDQNSIFNIFRVIEWRRIRWVEHVASREEKRDIFRVFMGKLEGKGLLGRPKHRWEDNIKMNFQEVGCGGGGGVWTG